MACLGDQELANFFKCDIKNTKTKKLKTLKRMNKVDTIAFAEKFNGIQWYN